MRGYLPSIEQIIGGYNVRYDKLLEIIPTHFAGTPAASATEVNLYIDITSMIKQCAGAVSDTKDKSLIITSSIINMCAHYRQFFKSRLGVYANIYIVLSGMVSSYNRKFVKEYSNAPTLDSDISVIDSAVDYLELITKYIQEVYFVRTEFEAGVAIYDFINSSTCPNIIITKDPYDYQLTGTNSSILRPKKSTTGDVSYIFSNDDAVMVYLLERKVTSVQTILGGDKLSCIMALTRLPERNIKSMKALPVIIKGLNALVDKALLIPGPGHVDISYVCTMLNNDGVKVDQYAADIRFNAIDIPSQWIRLKSTGYSISKYDPVNLYDPNSLKDLNNNEFKDHPLDIMAL